MTELIVIGVNHHRSPVELREQMNFPAADRARLLSALAADGLIDEGVLLSTCNRTELWASVYDTAVQSRLQDRLAQDRGVPADARPQWVAHHGAQAIHHLFRVTASLDAMVVGEAQILGQVKEAYHEARSLGLLQHILHRSLQRAFSVAKQVRNSTELARLPVSVSGVAVELAEQIFGKLSGKKILMIGSGEMGRLTARHLKEAGVGEIRLVSRGGDHAQAFATEFGAVLLNEAEMPRSLSEVDIVMAATASESPILTAEMVQAALPRRSSPLFCIDIAVPRNIDPRVNNLEDVYLYNIDDLQKVVAGNQAARRAEAEKAEEIVAVAVHDFVQELRRMQLVPAITSLHQRCEEIRQTEVERALARLPQATPEMREVVESCTQAVVAKILHQPVVQLKESHAELADDHRSPALDFFRRLFGLEV